MVEGEQVSRVDGSAAEVPDVQQASSAGEPAAWHDRLGAWRGGPGRVARRLATSTALSRAPRRGRDSGLAARRLEALQALATELAGALTTAQITDLLMARGIAALRADGAAVFLIEPGDQALTAIDWRGHSDNRARQFARLPIDTPMPATDVARTGEPVFIQDPVTYHNRYGSTFARLGVTPQLRAVAAVPLEVDGRRFGVLGFTWNHPIPWRPTARRSSPRWPAWAPARWNGVACSTRSARRSIAPRPRSGGSTCWRRPDGSSACRSTTRRSSTASRGWRCR